MDAGLTTRLRTERLELRPPSGRDVQELSALLRANAEHLRPWDPSPPPGVDLAAPAQVRARIEAWRRDWRAGLGYGLLICSREPGRPILGHARLSNVVRGAFHNAYLGYWIAAERQGRGLMTEAVGATVDFAFGPPGLHRVQAAILPRNGASRRVLEKAGFRPEGLARRYLAIAGAWEDHALYALTVEDRERRAGAPGTL